LTFTGTNRYPVWSPDGTKLAFNGSRNGIRKVYLKAANGTGTEELLLDADRLPGDWSRDGRYLFNMTSSQNPQTGNDIWVQPMVGERKPFPYLQTVFAEFFAQLSPDGRWLAYTSDESSRPEIYVVSFPSPGGKWQISTAGGARVAWSKNGKEIFYMSLDGQMNAVEVQTGSGFHAGVPKPLFKVRMTTGNTNFQVNSQGQFLIPVQEEQSAALTTVVVNWPSLLKK
jgi:Tol biopolymer transport system component